MFSQVSVNLFTVGIGISGTKSLLGGRYLWYQVPSGEVSILRDRSTWRVGIPRDRYLGIGIPGVGIPNE